MICPFNDSASFAYAGNFITQYYLRNSSKNVKKPYMYLYIDVEIRIGLLGINNQEENSYIALNMERNGEMREKKKSSYWPKFCTLPLDMEFLSLVLMLTVIGLIMLLSASYPAALHYKNDALL